MVDIQLSMQRDRKDDPRQKGKQLFERNKRRRQVEKTLFERKKPRTLADGAILRALDIEDADVINEGWCYKSRTSLKTIQNCLKKGMACFGIEQGGRLCAHIVRSRDGALGPLYVESEFRRKGYGRLLVQEAAKVLKELDKPCVCFIEKGDLPAESLFSSIGWVVSEHGNDEKGVYRNAAKQQWFLP